VTLVTGLLVSDFSGQGSGLIFKCRKMDVSTHEYGAVSNVEHLISSDMAPYTRMTVTSTEPLRKPRNQHTHVFLTIPRVKNYCYINTLNILVFVVGLEFIYF